MPSGPAHDPLPQTLNHPPPEPLTMDKTPTPLPEIPAKRYFTIGEVSELCGVKAYVLRYWEQEFTQLRPVKRRGNRRYYQHHEVLLIRRIRELLYEQGFTISGARNRLATMTPLTQRSVEAALAAEAEDAAPLAALAAVAGTSAVAGRAATAGAAAQPIVMAAAAAPGLPAASVLVNPATTARLQPGRAIEWADPLLRVELQSIRDLLEV
jgi:DNA-binding transcriptional MerR regulator